MDIIWEGPETASVWPVRILSDGLILIGNSAGEWVPADPSEEPALAELARRLLAERAEQAKLDEHNDELEEEERGDFGNAHSSYQARLDALSREVEEDGERNHGCHAAYERLLAELLARVKKLENQSGQIDVMWEVLYNNLYHPVDPWNDGRQVVGALTILRQLDGALNRPCQDTERPPLTAAGRALGSEVGGPAETAKLLAIEDALIHVEAARQIWLRLNSEGSCITDHLDLAVEVLEKASAK